ncbi:PI-actitoxin-Avd5a-like [Ctenopharyngodon idella]|uniref:PI-actitoxin-Avd5a-like n=1 Tax=Ctenopharyngodon idella TaxID=7959 RepID=UPI00222F6D10|nr:PI-actitoxin-Avd5a-like [Ctenopharyngodon idella]
MFARGVIVLLCVLVVVSEGERAPEPDPEPEPEPSFCPMIYFPVCGSDGITYGNECLLRAASQGSNTKIVILKHGRCDEDLQE